ncbi:ALF repeat-containing protein [Streptomyces sp. NPDC058731]|uniref:ALF repeat-containing protein n=1 Tax=Streptomyces sp. NPDC058731 TaxID=3346613 RepID=UPI0036A336A8
MIVLSLGAGLIAVPASATDTSAVQPPPNERAQVLALWATGSDRTQLEAEQALTASDAEVHAFLTNRAPELVRVDDRFKALSLMNESGPAVSAELTSALDGTPEQLAAYLKSGWRGALVMDQRGSVLRAMADGGRQVQAAGTSALDKGTSEALMQFLTKELPLRTAQDERTEALMIEATAGPNLRQAAQEALDGTPADVHAFLEEGQYVARARDRETLTVSQLADLAAKAGATAKAETAAAQKTADQAEKAATAAKQAATVAKEEMAKTQGASLKASDLARDAGRAPHR